MTDNIKQMIYRLQEFERIDMLDIGAVKKCALNRKMYDLIVLINSNLPEYMEYIRNQNSRA